MKTQPLKLTKKTLFIFKANLAFKDAAKSSDPTTSMVKTTATSTVAIV